MTDPWFERELAERVLRSERRRALILAAVLAALALFTEALLLVFHDPSSPDMVQIAWNYRIAVWFGLGLVAYELAVWRLLGRMLAWKRQPPVPLRYITSSLETLAPAAVMVATAAPPAHDVLTSPVTYAFYLFIILSALRLDPILCLFTGAVAASAYAGCAVWLFADLAPAERAQIELSIPGYCVRTALLLAGGVAAALVAQQIRRNVMLALQSGRDRQKILDLIGQHVSPAVVDQLLSQPSGLASQVRTVTLLVLDIRNFSTFSENRQPAEVVDYLNTLWGSLVEVLNRHNGVVNKFLGDGLMAVFGAPVSNGSEADDALRAARDILHAIERLAAEGRIPPTRVGIGLHAGEVVVGTVGSKRRREYTVIGDTVNVAFRIETLNKILGTTLLVSDEVRQSASQFPAEAELMPLMAVKGRDTPIQLHCLAR